MDWLLYPALLIYFMIGWFLADSCADGADDMKMLVFVTWPLVIGLFVIAIIVLSIIGFVDFLLRFIYGWRDDTDGSV